MKISRKWLQKYFDKELPTTETLADALTFHVFEIDGVEKYNPRQGDDVSDDVLDVKVTPNRGHDALSHQGIARELSAILNVPLAHDPLLDKVDLSKKTDAVTVSIEIAELCPRYIAGYIKGVKVAPSPQWLQDRLAAVGQRSINNVVDATNFVMFNLGQPLHAFDAGQLSNKSGAYNIGVRRARVDEIMTALDGKNYTLGVKDLVIEDADLHRPIGIAGVKGGMPAAITEKTKDIIIEAANFDGATVRKTAVSLKLRTDASARFEQGLSPELAAYGMHAVVQMIMQLAGGELIGFVDEYKMVQKPTEVAVSVAQAQQVAGQAMSEHAIANAFDRLGFTYKKNSGAFVVTPPFLRLDLQLPEDLIEEAARIVGYDKIMPRELPALQQKPAVNKNFYYTEQFRDFFVQWGFSEVYTSVFTSKGARAVLNNVSSDKPFLRSSLEGGLTDVLEKNIRNKELLGLEQVRLFEIGTVWGPAEEVQVGIAVERLKNKPKAAELLSALAQQFHITDIPQQPDVDVLVVPLETFIAQVPEPTAYPSLPLSSAAQYKVFSKYPYIVRDIAMWASVEGAGPEFIKGLQKTISEAAGPLCVRVELFDQFAKDGRTSLAFRLIFQSFDRTLTEAEVNQIMDTISQTLKTKGFEIR